MKSIKLLIAFVTLFFTEMHTLAQADTVIYRDVNNAQSNLENAHTIFRFGPLDPNNTYLGTKSSVNDEGNETLERNYLIRIESDTVNFVRAWPAKESKPLTDSTDHRIVTQMDSDGVLQRKEFTPAGVLLKDGRSRTVFPPHYTDSVYFYYPENGRLRLIAHHSENKMLHNRHWDEEGQELISDVFSYVDEIAEYPGGDSKLFQYLGANIKYPAVAQDAGVMGTVYINFIVMEDGEVKQARVVRSVHTALDTESLRVVNMMPRWKPAMRDGEPVRFSFNLPVKYSLR